MCLPARGTTRKRPTTRPVKSLAGFVRLIWERACADDGLLQPQDVVRACRRLSPRVVIDWPHAQSHNQYEARPFWPSGFGARSRTVSLSKTRPGRIGVTTLPVLHSAARLPTARICSAFASIRPQPQDD